MTVNWILDNATTNGQYVRKSYHAVVTGGRLYRETLSILSGKPSQVSGSGGQQPQELVIAEASIFVTSATSALTWAIESQTQEGDVQRTLYSALESGSTKHLYLSISTQSETPGLISGAQGTSGAKNASMSISGPV